MEITTWRINSESIHLNQLLKKPSVELLLKQSIAKGERMISTSIKIYLKAKRIINAKDEIDKIPLKIPFKDKASKLEIAFGSKVEINVTKDISLPKIFWPSSQKKELIRLVDVTRNLQMDSEKFIDRPLRKALMKNLLGDSICIPIRLANISLPA